MGPNRVFIVRNQENEAVLALNMETIQIWKNPCRLRLVTYSPGFHARKTPRHRHFFYELGLVFGGQCTWHLGSRRKVMLRSGDALLLRPNRWHGEETKPGSPARVAWLGFDFEGVPPSWCQQAVTLGANAVEAELYFRIIAREHQWDDARSCARVDMALQSFLLLLDRCAEGPEKTTYLRSRLNPRQVNTVESAAYYLRNNLRDPLSIAQVAAYHSLCPAHFSSIFRRHHGTNPRRYLRQARLEAAADLLTSSDISLKEVSARCGFVDAGHLCKTFKQDLHVTPSHFRAQRLRLRAGHVGREELTMKCQHPFNRDSEAALILKRAHRQRSGSIRGLAAS